MSMRKFSVVVLKMGLLFSICLFLLQPVMAATVVPVNRPVDGSTVREVVDILVPASSVPSRGYVIYKVDGRFKCAEARTTPDNQHYVYGWNTKALDPDTSLPMNRRECKDGAHAISVVVCDSRGRTVGESKSITVFVKNQLSASDLPSQGIRLRYRHKPGTTTKYHFKWSIDLDSVSGNTDYGRLLGYGLEGSDGNIERSIEAVESDGRALVRDQLIGTVMKYQNGNLVPSYGVDTKSSYLREDSLGRGSEVSTFEAGSPVGITVPILPWQKVRIGDEWMTGQQVWWDALSRQSVKMKTDAAFEGLEWQNGYRCAKIVSRFSETVKIPFSTVLQDPIQIDGETTTYFCYSIGKVISSYTTGTAKCSMDQTQINALIASRMPKAVSGVTQASAGGAAKSGGGMGMGRMGGGMGMGRMGGGMGMGRMGGGPLAGGGMPGVGGPAGMGDGPAGATGSRPGTTGPNVAKKSDVVFKITESIEAIR